MRTKSFLPIALATLALLYNACDSSSTNEPEASTNETITIFDNFDMTEIPQSCTAQLDRNMVTLDIVLKDWSIKEVQLFNGNKVLFTTIYNGLDEQELGKICDLSKNEIKKGNAPKYLANTDCEGNVFSGELLLEGKDTLITPALLALTHDITCNRLLNGTLTIGEFMSGNDESKTDHIID